MMGKEKFCLCHELHFLIFTGFQDILDLSVKNTLGWEVKSEGGEIFPSGTLMSFLRRMLWALTGGDSICLSLWSLTHWL